MCRSHSHDSDLDLQAGVRLTIPRPRDDPLMDREALTASPPHVMSMDSHLTDLASTLHLGNVPTAPLKVTVCASNLTGESTMRVIYTAGVRVHGDLD
jgi:enterochelin esterase-like enzyme